MAISSTSNKTTVTTAASTGPFSIPFLLNNSSELTLIHISTALVESTYSSTQFSVAGSFPSSTGTFSITSTGDVLASTNQQFLAKRVVPNIQSVDLPPAGGLPPVSIEEGLDNIVMITQQLDETISRSLTFAAGSTVSNASLPSPSSGQYLHWSTANTLQNSGTLSTSVSVSTFWQGVLDDTASTESLANLGALGTTGTPAAAGAIAAYSSTGVVLLSPRAPTISTAGVIGGHYASVSTFSTSFTLSSSEAGKILDMGSSTSCTITLPGTTTTTLVKGFQVSAVRNTTQTITFALGSTQDSLLSESTKVTIGAQYGAVSLVKIAASSSTSNWSLAGNLA